MKYPQLVSMPSEISDWLEEQLEARGIDAVVYTRYILSLLYRDSADVICPDQDSQFTQPNKEVRRSGGSRKRFRHSTEWWGPAQADAEQLKRSAAVECLMSASDQNCGIESLVDELCEKLKEIKNDSSVNTDSSASTKSNELQNISPQDLAKRYYAAFPPLSHNCAGSSPAIVTLIPKWFASPKKKGSCRRNRSSSCEEKLHHKIDCDSMKVRTPGKQKFGYFSRSKNDLGYSRSMAKSVERSESMTDWDLYMFSNNAKNKLSIGNRQQLELDKDKCQASDESLTKTEYNCNNPNLWNNDENMNMYDDLPVDIMELLDSPSPQDYSVDMMNLANMRDVGNKNFIQCGTNITSSIWSTDAVMEDATMFDNSVNSALDANHSETLLGLKFDSLSVGNKQRISECAWSNSDVNIIAENETNLFFESCAKSSLLSSIKGNYFGFDNIIGTPWEYTAGIEKFAKWSEAEYFDTENHLQGRSKSYIKLNHNKEESSFTEVLPRPTKAQLGFSNKASNTANLTAASESTFKNSSSGKEEENLLTSMRSHFRPINTVNEVLEANKQRQYADGANFVISSNLDNPPYKRSKSGFLYIDSENGSPRKLLEYNGKEKTSELVLKFHIRQNDKACQTENEGLIEAESPQEVPCKKRVISEPEDFYFPGDKDILVDDNQTCSCNTNKLENKMENGNKVWMNCPLHSTRPDSMMAEIMWKFESKQCDKCNNNSTWTRDSLTKEEIQSKWQLNKETIRNIWNGGEVCSACLGSNGGRPPLSLLQSQLREDISQDGEQLLSDLSSLQKSYMEQLPLAEVSYDISELLVGSKERKRRHSPVFGSAKNAVPVHRGSWSIASHLKQDRLIQMTSIPILHSVTL